jgi:hypothetical protein
MKPPYQYNDGGRTAQGYKGHTGDCVARSVAIATGSNYTDIYEIINKLALSERKGKRKRGISSARTGVYKNTIKKLMNHIGAEWTPIMGIGTGCTVHLCEDELPKKGRYVLSVSKHLCAWIDGVLHDTHDCSREGKRCVYGYWKLG